MKSDNFQNSPKSTVEKIIDMIPTSADFAMLDDNRFGNEDLKIVTTRV